MANTATKPRVDRHVQLLAYRTTGLLELGFNLSQTLRLAKRTDVVHEAKALLDRGWPHEYVTGELEVEER